MFIDGIGIAGYKSFGSDFQLIGPFKKINLLIGQNNSGKSNILSFLTQLYSACVISAKDRGEIKLDLLDRHIGDDSGYFRVAFGLTLDGVYYQKIIKELEKTLNSNDRGLIENILKSPIMAHNGVSWFYYEHPWTNRIAQLHQSSDVIEKLISARILNRNEWYTIWNRILRIENGDIKEHWIPQIMQKLSPVQFTPPKVNIIPAIRRVSDGDVTESEDYSGIGLIRRLAMLQHPELEHQSMKVYFDNINGFLRKVTANQSATLEIPHSLDTILVHMDGKTLPLSSLGTGIHEVVILASAATVLRNQVLCIEEPELHLHPLLQKKLIRYLQEKTDNQYFITTHSAHLLDTPDSAIFHIRQQSGHTTVENVYSAVDKAYICADLGYRASDLLQANSVIWVEGPSDRIYLNHWVKSMAPDLIEGIHYTIMFYGGRLLSHLSASDVEVADFISLRRLNRYISIVIDSDKTNPHRNINETKRRIRDEFNQGPGFAWVTQGREIENYVSPDIIKLAVKDVHKTAARILHSGQYDHCLHYETIKGAIVEDVDKVKIAHAATRHPLSLDILDLKATITKLVHFIREANDFDQVD